MASRKPLTNDEGEVRELTQEDFSRAVPFSALPNELKEVLSPPDRTVVPDTEPKKRKRTAA
jgi:hypothetical protein